MVACGMFSTPALIKPAYIWLQGKCCCRLPADAVAQQLGDQVDGLDQRVEEGVEPAAVRNDEVTLRVGQARQTEERCPAGCVLPWASSHCLLTSCTSQCP